VKTCSLCEYFSLYFLAGSFRARGRWENKRSGPEKKEKKKQRAAAYLQYQSAVTAKAFTIVARKRTVIGGAVVDMRARCWRVFSVVLT